MRNIFMKIAKIFKKVFAGKVGLQRVKIKTTKNNYRRGSIQTKEVKRWINHRETLYNWNGRMTETLA